MNFLRKNAEKEFDVQIVSSVAMENAQELWNNIIQYNPPWLSENTRTINFAKFMCQYTAKKVCMDLAVHVEGSERADYIDSVIGAMVDKSLRDKVEDALGLGGIILKPNGTYNKNNAVDYILPSGYVVTEKNSNGDILGAIFVDRLVKGEDNYTRLEYHHFEHEKVNNGEVQRLYVIENKAYKSAGKNALGEQVNLDSVDEWKTIKEEYRIDNVEKPLFGYLKMPTNNTIDYDSPEGVSIFSNCLEELRDLDIAWSRKGDEVEDSQHMTFIDETALAKNPKTGQKKLELPRFVKGIRKGVDSASTIDEHVATLLTGNRIEDINSILSMISTKAGFSQGQFVLDRKTGVLTATQIESQDSETMETINDIRKALKTAINDLIYALDKYCDVFFDMPSGYVDALDDEVEDEDIYYFKDLLATPEADRTRAYQLMLQGVYSKRKYLKEYEGFSDDEIDEMMEEIRSEVGEQQGLFA